MAFERAFQQLRARIWYSPSETGTRVSLSAPEEQLKKALSIGMENCLWINREENKFLRDINER